MEVNSGKGLNVLVGSIMTSVSSENTKLVDTVSAKDGLSETDFKVSESKASELQGNLQGVPENFKDEEQLKKEAEARMKAMNSLFKDLDASLQFGWHEEAAQLTVKFVDTEKDKVLYEYPAKDFLDNIARIRKMVGLFVDHKV